jgi:hypothetical protein
VSKIGELFRQELKVINVGLESFYSDLKRQKVEVIQVNWRPPAGGNKKLISLLNKLKS